MVDIGLRFIYCHVNVSIITYRYFISSLIYLPIMFSIVIIHVIIFLTHVLILLVFVL